MAELEQFFLYRPDSTYTQILVFKKSYVLTAGKNEIEIDIYESMFDSSASKGHDYINVAIYSNDSGAFTSQSGHLYLYSNGEPFAWYGNFSDFNVEINNYIPPQNYWSGNISTNKVYPCIDVYMEEKIPKYKSGIIHVSKDGTGDYSTIMDAVRNAGDVDSHTTIILQEGIYDEIVYLGNKHNISIIGVNREQCVMGTKEHKNYMHLLYKMCGNPGRKRRVKGEHRLSFLSTERRNYGKSNF